MNIQHNKQVKAAIMMEAVTCKQTGTMCEVGKRLSVIIESCVNVTYIITDLVKQIHQWGSLEGTIKRGEIQDFFCAALYPQLSVEEGKCECRGVVMLEFCKLQICLI